MGLDMYLYGKRYIKDWEHNYDGQVIPDDTPAKQCQKAIGSKFPVTEVTVDLGYWRKANAIHKWFVTNVQGGVDECQESYVVTEQLAELRNLCAEVMEKRGGKDSLFPGESKAEEASKLLPTGSGFFFGGTEYDEWYYADIQYTKDLLDKLLADEEAQHLDIYYRASW